MKKNVIRIVMCCIALLVVGLTAILPITKNLTRVGQRNLIAKADTLDTTSVFTSSFVNLTHPVYSSSSSSSIITSVRPINVSFQISFYLDPNTNKYMLKPSFLFPASNNRGYFRVYEGVDDGDPAYTQYHTYNYAGLHWFQCQSYGFQNEIETNGSHVINPFYLDCYIEIGGAFNCNVRRITYETVIDPNYNSRFDTRIRFYDENNNYLHVSMWTGFFNEGCYSFVTSPTSDFIYVFGLSPRTMYLSGDLTDSDIFQNGLTQGYNDGYSQGESNGYNNGYSAGDINGYNRGYTNGYNDGADDAGTYTFTSLIGSVIDVPVQTFTSLFHFEILGVYLDGFFLGLLTLCVIVSIVKLVL